MNHISSMPNVNQDDLAIHIIDSDKNRGEETFAQVQSMLPAASVKTYLHPELYRRRLFDTEFALKSTQELDKPGNQDLKELLEERRQYNIILSRPSFDDFNKVVSPEKSEAYDSDSNSIRDSKKLSGLFATLENYFHLLAENSSKFFTAVLLQPDPTKGIDTSGDLDEDKHILNYPCPEGFSYKEDAEIPGLVVSGNDEMDKISLEKLFKHFDNLIGLNS